MDVQQKVKLFVLGTDLAHFKLEEFIRVLSIQHYVIKFVRLVTDQWFSPGTAFSSTNKTDSYDIIEILLKVALNIINLNYIYL
jgi:hypothetical protein